MTILVLVTEVVMVCFAYIEACVQATGYFLRTWQKQIPETNQIRDPVVVCVCVSIPMRVWISRRVLLIKSFL